MKKKSKLFINCDEAVIICDKSQYNEATWLDKLKLNLHLLLCGMCKKYSSNNTKLTSLCSKAKLNALSNEQKEVMKKVIETESLKKQ
ncbi:hypothetical protein SAMN04487906_2212 [Zhouia amylolytica]|nr:hypothetical protein [Zhouia amylolytica]SFS93839.1 hypothetical protein SAMN04487906_2212 [Zhouia amylolytica]